MYVLFYVVVFAAVLFSLFGFCLGAGGGWLREGDCLLVCTSLAHTAQSIKWQWLRPTTTTKIILCSFVSVSSSSSSSFFVL